MAETGEEDAREKFVLWSKTDKHTRQGAVLDIDTGMLRRDHVLVLRSPQAEITLGLGGTSAALMDFAKSGDTRDDPFLKACGEADQAIARGDFEGTRDLGVPDVIPLQKVISDTSKEAEMMRTRREDQVGHVTRNRSIARNAWVVAGTRIPVGSIRRLHEDGYTVAQIIEEYPDLRPEDIEAALAHKPKAA